MTITADSLDTASDGARTAEQWITLISSTWRKAAGAIIETGKFLIAAKADLKKHHGQWLPMIERGLPFSARTAQRLMAIAEHPVLSDATFLSHLPPSWSILYALSRLPEATLRDAINQGHVHCEMETSDLLGLTPDAAPKPETASPREEPREAKREAGYIEIEKSVSGRWPTGFESLREREAEKAAMGDDVLTITAPPPRPSTGRQITEKDFEEAARGRHVADLAYAFKVFDPGTADPRIAAKRLLDAAPPPELWPSHHVHYTSAQIERCGAVLAAIAKLLARRATSPVSGR